MNPMTLDEVCAKWPTLCRHGMNPYGSFDWPSDFYERPGTFKERSEKHHAAFRKLENDLAEAAKQQGRPDQFQFELARAFLTITNARDYICKKPPPNSGTSYGLKHQAERYLCGHIDSYADGNPYVGNGAMIAALLAEGIPIDEDVARSLFVYDRTRPDGTKFCSAELNVPFCLNKTWHAKLFREQNILYKRVERRPIETREKFIATRTDWIKSVIDIMRRRDAALLAEGKDTPDAPVGQRVIRGQLVAGAE